MFANYEIGGDLIVVDSSSEDYALLANDEQLSVLTWRYFATGEAALRGVDPSPESLWLVNMQLSDVTGVALVELLRQRSRHCPVFLVSDSYAPAEEVAARVAGASAYLWKPADLHWLDLCRHAMSAAASRRGMQRALG